MHREVKVGLVVIGGLLVLFGSALYYRLTRPSPGASALAGGAHEVTTAKPTLVPAEAEGGASPLPSTPGDPPPTYAAHPTAQFMPQPTLVEEPSGRYSQQVEVEPADVADGAANGRPYAEDTSARYAVQPSPAAGMAATVVETHPGTAQPLVVQPQHDPRDYGQEAVAPIAEPARREFSPASTVRLTGGDAGVPARGGNADPFSARGDRYAPPAASPNTAGYGTADGYAPAGAPITPRQRTGALVVNRNARPERGEYTVQPNDSFWTISQKVYGTGSFFRALYQYNQKDHPWPDKLKVGKVVRVPPTEALMQAYPHLCPRPSRHEQAMRAQVVNTAARAARGGRIYVVERGDTLFDIAKYELGDVSRWGEIYELNQDLLGPEFDYLSPGMELVLPGEGEPADSVTRRPGYGVQR